MDNRVRYWAIVPAAGVGRRMEVDVPKQFLQLGDRTVLEHSLDALFSVKLLDGLVLVTGGDVVVDTITRRYRTRGLLLAGGGKERCHSVLNGLQVLAGQATAGDWVLVHDAARPCVRSSDLEHLVETLAGSTSGGLLGLPVYDTLKRADVDGFVRATLQREGIWRAFTPQMFRFGVLQSALQQSIADGFEVTDEASAMEHAGYRPQLVEGHADNIKITRPEDLPLAEFFLTQQGRL
jgi:2-C-methyl-D-erythritol 4-phosphate cytidylyltransferase